ncbi:MAG: hypothetical protein IPQ07_27660 [Myxococcales bacterium]|nr:hypothetical protein [Myxococcales bacterium]
MQDIDAIEAINFEQLVTVTDRLLLRGRPARRPSTSRITVERVDQAPELTLRLKPNQALWRRFTTTALFTALFSVTAAIVSLL